jgi:hypothetical protein
LIEKPFTVAFYKAYIRQLYAKLAQDTEAHIITAMHDELYGQELVGHITVAQERTIDATHNLVCDERKKLLRKLEAILV